MTSKNISFDFEEKDKISTKAEHLTPPIITYVLRKLVLGLILVLVGGARQLSKVYGFYFEATVSDREKWVWEPHKKLPRYRAQVEKVE